MTATQALILADREARKWEDVAVDIGWQLVLARLLLREKFAELGEARRSNERLREQLRIAMGVPS